MLVLFSGYLSAAELNVTQNQLPITLGQYLGHWEDPSTELTINDIMAEEPNWVRSSESVPTLGLSPSAHWFSIILSGEGMHLRRRQIDRECERTREGACVVGHVA